MVSPFQLGTSDIMMIMHPVPSNKLFHGLHIVVKLKEVEELSPEEQSPHKGASSLKRTGHEGRQTVHL